MSEATYRIVYKGDIKLNTYVEMLKENGMLVPVEATDRICTPHMCALPVGWELDRCWAILDGVAKDANGYDSGELCQIVDVVRLGVPA